MAVAELDERLSTLEAVITRLQADLVSLHRELESMRATLLARDRHGEFLQEQIRAERESSQRLQAELVEAQSRLRSAGPRVKDWTKVVGMFADDPGFDEAVRLGREYRQQQPIVGEE